MKLVIDDGVTPEDTDVNILGSSGKLLESLRVSASGDHSKSGDTLTKSSSSPLKDQLQKSISAMAGMPLTRMNSAEDKLNSSLPRPVTDEENATEEMAYAAFKIANCYRRLKKIRSIKKTIQAVHTNDASKLISIISKPSTSFEEYQKLLSTPEVQQQLSKFLSSLPLDPKLKNKNSQSRSSRTFMCCLIIAYFPQEILLADDEKDDSLPAENCFTTSCMLIRSLQLMIHSLAGSSVKFHKHMLVYRYSMRSFMHFFEAWKKIDRDRVAQSMELPYAQAYSVLLAAKHALASSSEEEKKENVRVMDQTIAHLQKIKTMYLRLLGQAGELRLEEINAVVESRNPIEFVLSDDADTRMVFNAAAESRLQDLSSEISASAISSANPAIQESQLRLLEKLSAIAGVENERLAYELCVDPTYRLPDAADPSSVTYPYSLTPSATTSTSLQPSPSMLRDQMLRLISDRLVWSLLKSPYATPDDVTAGSLGPWRVLGSPAEAGTKPSANGQLLTGKILSIAHDEEEDGFVYCDVEFLCDGAIERRVPLLAPVLYSVLWDADAAQADPLPFLQSLEDIATRIGSLTPNRPELLQQLLKSLDFAFLHQMLTTRSIGGDEITIVACKIFFAVDQLQSPARLEEPRRKAWVAGYLAALRNSASFQQRVLLLPPFFEFVSASIEQISRDMANYYLTGLVPVLREQGSFFLAAKLMQRVDSGRSSLQVLAAQIIQQLAPISQLNTSIQALAEAGVNSATALLQKCPDSTGLAGHVDALVSNEEGGWLRQGVVALILTNLLQLPVRLDSREGAKTLPETFLWDAKRLAAMRDQLDTIVVMASLSVTSKQQIAQLMAQLQANTKQILCSPTEEDEYLRRLNILLLANDCSLTQLTTETQRHVRACIEARHHVTKLNSIVGWEVQLEAAIKAVVLEQSAVLNLFTKRVIKVVLACALSKPWRPKLAALSLSNKRIEEKLHKMGEALASLLASNMNVYADVYRLVMSAPSVRAAFSAITHV